jgi:hypothetical protein
VSSNLAVRVKNESDAVALWKNAFCRLPWCVLAVITLILIVWLLSSGRISHSLQRPGGPLGPTPEYNLSGMFQ